MIAVITSEEVNKCIILIETWFNAGRYSLPRDAPPAHVARAALLDDGRHTTI